MNILLLWVILTFRFLIDLEIVSTLIPSELYKNFVFFFSHSFLNVSSISFWTSPLKNVIFSLIIPAFSFAISDNESPNTFWWSYPTFVTRPINGDIIFVESNLPPKPTSIIAISIFLNLKYSNANNVEISKNDGWILLKSLKFELTKSLINFFFIFLPSTWILSLKSNIWGDENKPILKFKLRHKFAIVVEVVPFPFVPPTWTEVYFFCGLSNFSHNNLILWSPGLIAELPTFW